MVRTPRRPKGDFILIRTFFEPNRLERMTLQAAYDYLVPIGRRVLSVASRVDPGTKVTPQPERRVV